MQAKKLVKEWFRKWEEGDFFSLPITENFKHTSPFGTISGKETYLNLAKSNKEKFLGYSFEIIDEIYQENRACVRYLAKQGNRFSLDVSEWYYFKGSLINEIVAYYHIGEIREERQLTDA